MIVLCGVVTPIEGTQKSKSFFLTLEYWDFTSLRTSKMYCYGLELFQKCFLKQKMAI